VAVIDRLLEWDPSIRWQVMRDVSIGEGWNRAPTSGAPTMTGGHRRKGGSSHEKRN
jgi:hypothetical protein